MYMAINSLLQYDPCIYVQEFHKPAMDAGITLMNEVGVDPGIDHMLAMECFDEVHSNGGKVVIAV